MELTEWHHFILSAKVRIVFGAEEAMVLSAVSAPFLHGSTVC